MDLIPRRQSLDAPLEVGNIWGGTVLDLTVWVAKT
jgi:hypothetical protein